MHKHHSAFSIEVSKCTPALPARVPEQHSCPPAPLALLVVGIGHLALAIAHHHQSQIMCTTFPGRHHHRLPGGHDGAACTRSRCGDGRAGAAALPQRSGPAGLQHVQHPHDGPRDPVRRAFHTPVFSCTSCIRTSRSPTAPTPGVPRAYHKGHTYPSRSTGGLPSSHVVSQFLDGPVLTSSDAPSDHLRSLPSLARSGLRAR